MFRTQKQDDSGTMAGIFAAAFELAPLGALLLQGDRERGAMILRANQAALEILGREKEQVEGAWLTRSGILISTEDEFTEALDLVSRVLDGDQRRFTIERHMMDGNGDRRLLKMTVAPLVSRELGEIDGHEVHAIMHIEDITEQRRTELELEYRAGHDSLTGLMNRRRFTEMLIQRLAEGRRYGEHGALLMVDIDSFKRINEDFGQEIGDAVLKEVAVRMRLCLRGSDSVGRMGGDEFAILLPTGGIAEAESVADKLLGVFRGSDPLLIPVAEDQEDLFEATRGDVSLSIGIVALDGSWPDPDTAYAAAASAMHAAKAAGGDGIAIRHGRRN